MISDLEERLGDLGRHVEFPATPPLSAMVGARLVASPQRQLRWPLRLWLRVATSGPLTRRMRLGLLALAAAVGVVVGVPPLRTTVAHWLGLQGVVISPRTALPAHASPHPTLSPSGLGSNLDLGQRITLDEARRTAGFPVLLPPTLGPPDAVFTRSELGSMITLVYAPRSGLPASNQTGVGLLITEFRGAANPMAFQKFVGPDTTVTALTVDGGAGFYLGGAPHQLAYDLPDGSIAVDTLRLAGPTLLFERGDLTLRLEGSLSEAESLAIAQSLR